MTNTNIHKCPACVKSTIYITEEKRTCLVCGDTWYTKDLERHNTVLVPASKLRDEGRITDKQYWKIACGVNTIDEILVDGDV